MAQTDAYVPDPQFVGKNLFFLVLTIAFFILIGFMITSIRKNKARNYGPIENSYSAKLVTDSIRHSPVQNQHLECPRDPHQYSYTFFLKIDDYYCNRGYWKCVMIKGSPVTENAVKCKDAHTDNLEVLDTSLCDGLGINNRTYQTDDKFAYITDTEQGQKNLDLLVQKINSHKTNGIVIEGNTDLFKRLDVICTALQAGEEGIKLLTYAVVNCGLFRDKTKLNAFRMSKGVCEDFIRKHRLYCDKVYAIDKKVARQADMDRLNQINELESQANSLASHLDTMTEPQKQQLDNKLKDMRAEIKRSRKYDDFDSICSVDNYLNKYPGIIPDTVEVLKENDLINLSQKNKMDLMHDIETLDNLEGCYAVSSITPSSSIQVLKNSGADKNTCNRLALEGGFDYFGLHSDSKCVGYAKDDLIHQPAVYPNGKCNLDGRKGIDANHQYISKVVEVGTHIVSDCWRNVINRYPYQSPGVWLHPFVNNLRIVFTTNSQDDYHKFINDMVHANKGNPRNQEIKPIRTDFADHPHIESQAPEVSGCEQGTIPVSFNYYRESFDVLNIPINNEFHLGIIVNGQSVEIYLDSKLKQTMKLFGNPTFNNGDLHINPETNPRLGGTVREFQFFPTAIDYRNISKIMKNRVAEQSRLEEPVMVSKEHSHQIELVHDHEFHPLEETNHTHPLKGDDLPEEYV